MMNKIKIKTHQLEVEVCTPELILSNIESQLQSGCDILTIGGIPPKLLALADNQKTIQQACQLYSNYPIKYILPGLLNYKKKVLNSTLQHYKIALKTLKNLGIAWVQLNDPIFVTDIDHEHQDKIIHAYQEIAENAPKILLATYFGGVEENMGWMKKIPMDGLHLDLEAAPEQLMFVLKNDLMKSLKVLSLGGLKKTEHYAHSIQAYLEHFIEYKPQIWLSMLMPDTQSIKQKKINTADFQKQNASIDIIQLYLEIDLHSDNERENNLPKLLLLNKLIKKIKSHYPAVKFLMPKKSVLEATFFMKKRDREFFMQEIKLLSEEA